jgi:hypothetical protein
VHSDHRSNLAPEVLQTVPGIRPVHWARTRRNLYNCLSFLDWMLRGTGFIEHPVDARCAGVLLGSLE